MLQAELNGHSYRKSQHREALIPQLSGRSKGSVEFKHQNISAVLAELDRPYIDGYKPRGNYQGILATEVERYLEDHPRFLEQLAAAPTLNPISVPQPSTADRSQIFVEPPEMPVPTTRVEKPWLSRKGQKIDFAERDAANRALARLGEEFVFDVERNRLREEGRDDLASKVRWVSQEIGDGLGFDILSYDETDESEMILEVKATGRNILSAFYVTANEVRCSEDIPDQYHLFRVFNLAREPRIYVLHGSLRERCQLEPLVFRAMI